MTLRVFLLPLLALGAVATVLGVQLASGGGDFRSPAPAAACVEAALPPASAELEQVAESLVLLGVGRAACELGVSRERLILALPSPPSRAALAKQTGRTELDLAAALKRGLTGSVTDLERGDRLPPASALLESYSDQLGLPGFAASALQRLPDSAIDGLLPTADVLRRAINDVDVGALLGSIDDPADLEGQLRTAIRDAAIAEARARVMDRIRGLLP